ncbi:hypothetical protein SUGI_0736920 [Cryptomeria japonica]|nr:hypothetical protein SUGI_0736920 [Cryptomeria japonica]
MTTHDRFFSLHTSRREKDAHKTPPRSRYVLKSHRTADELLVSRREFDRPTADADYLDLFIHKSLVHHTLWRAGLRQQTEAREIKP